MGSQWSCGGIRSEHTCPCCSSKILLLSHHTGSDRPTLASGLPGNRFQNCYHWFQGLALPTTFLPCWPQWYLWNHFPQLHPAFGTNCLAICHLFRLFQFSVNILVSTTFFSGPTMALSLQPSRLFSPVASYRPLHITRSSTAEWCGLQVLIL